MKIYLFFLIFIIGSCTMQNDAKQNDAEIISSENEFCSKYTDWPRTNKFDMTCQKVIQIKDKNLILVGLDSESTNNILKIDDQGNKLWSLNFSKKNLFAESIFETPIGDIEIIFKFGLDSLFYAKLSKDGNLLQDITNIPLNVGEIKKTEIIEENKIILFFIDENGKTNVQKLKIQPLTLENSNKFWLYFIYDLAIKQNGDIIIIGNENMAKLICLDKNLIVKWEQSITHGKNEYIIYPTDIFVDYNDEFIISNFSNNYNFDSLGLNKSYMTKYTSSGKALWTKEYGCDKLDIIPLDMQTYNNRVFVTGIANNIALEIQGCFLQCLDENGDEIYRKIYDGSSTSNYSSNIFKSIADKFLLVFTTKKRTFIANVNDLGEN